MKEIELYLIPQPGAKPEFLAKCQVVDPSPVVTRVWNDLVRDNAKGDAAQIVLEGYTRDGWAWKPSDRFVQVTVASVDGRNKLPGFVDYLKERQKCCYGRFAPEGVLVVSYVQHSREKNRMTCRIATDLTSIAGCTLKPKTPQSKPQTNSKPKEPTAAPRKKGGFLGKLVGAQQRTNQDLAIATQKKRSAQQRPVGNGGSSEATTPPTATKTPQEVLAEFRQSMQDKMLDFDMAPEEVLKVPIQLSEHTACLSEQDRTKVTMDILKYMVYEAAEDVNDEWIAHKEPAEFMDEAVIAVYKEGAAPAAVLEEINRGELPDEVRGQQRAIAEQRQRAVQTAESKVAQRTEIRAVKEETQYEEDLEVLNTTKRDRRTIEDYEREKRKQQEKRSRVS